MARLATREQAADYVGLSLSSFDNWIRLGRLPGPLKGTKRWDLVAIDIAIDRLSGLKGLSDMKARRESIADEDKAVKKFEDDLARQIAAAKEHVSIDAIISALELQIFPLKDDQETELETAR